MTKHLSQIFPWLVAVLVFFIPSNLFLVLNESLGYVNGLRVDYVIPKLFLTDLLTLAVIGTGLFLSKEKILRRLKNAIFIKRERLLFVAVLMVITIQVFSTDPSVSFFSVLKGLELCLLSIIILEHKNILKKDALILAVSASILVQLFFSVYQFIYQTSLTPYWLSGESNLSSGLIGLARGSYSGEERLLAYGTTPHPNILAGVVVLLSLSIIVLFQKKKPLWLLLLPCAVLIMLTQSVSAAAALALGIFGITKERIVNRHLEWVILFLVLISPLVITMLSSHWPVTSLTRRRELFMAAYAMLQDKPWLGVGITNFTAVLENYITNKEFVRFIQPVHNTLWLYLAETGLIGALALFHAIKRLTYSHYLHPVSVALIPILALDHYLITSQVGLLTLIFFLVFTLRKKVTHPLQAVDRLDQV